MKSIFPNSFLKAIFTLTLFPPLFTFATQTTQIGQKASELPIPNTTQITNSEVLKACGLELPVAADVSQAITHRLNIKTLEKKCSKTVQILNCISPQKLFETEVYGEGLIELLVKITYEECLPGLKNLNPDERNSFICRYTESNIRSHDLDLNVSCEVDPKILKTVVKARLALEATEAERKRIEELEKRKIEEEQRQADLDQERIENLNMEIQHEIYSNNQYILDKLDKIEKNLNQAISIQQERNLCYSQKKLNSKWTLFGPENNCAKEIDRSIRDRQHTSSYYYSQMVHESKDLYDLAQNFELTSEYDQRVESYRNKVSEFVRKAVDTSFRIEVHNEGAIQVCRNELKKCKQ